MLHSAPACPACTLRSVASVGFSAAFQPNKPKRTQNEAIAPVLCKSYISYICNWLAGYRKFSNGFVLQKNFFSRSPSSASFTNALRPDCPLRQLRGQQNSSEDSESTERTENSEGTESTDQPGRVGILACPVENTSREACIPRAVGCRLPSWGQARMPVATYRQECLPYLLKRKKREPRLDEAPL